MANKLNANIFDVSGRKMGRRSFLKCLGTSLGLGLLSGGAIAKNSKACDADWQFETLMTKKQEAYAENFEHAKQLGRVREDLTKEQAIADFTVIETSATETAASKAASNAMVNRVGLTTFAVTFVGTCIGIIRGGSVINKIEQQQASLYLAQAEERARAKEHEVCQM